MNIAKNMPLCFGLITLVAGLAYGDTRNRIYEYSAYQAPGENYEIDPTGRWIQIKEMWGGCSAAYRFKFEARTEESQGGQWVDIGPGEIRGVDLHEDAQNPCVIIEINGNPNDNHIYGATDVWKIDLPTYWTSHSELWRLRISGNLGQTWMSAFDKIGLVEIDGNLAGKLEALDGPIGSVTIGGYLQASVIGDSLQTVSVEGGGTHTGSIETYSSYPYSIFVNGQMNGNIVFNSYSTVSGTVTVTGAMSGDLTARWSDVTGQLDIGGSASGLVQLGTLRDTGSVTIGGGLAGSGRIEHASTVYPCQGDITIVGNSAGQISLVRGLEGTLEITGDLHGEAQLGTASTDAVAGTVKIGADVRDKLMVTGDLTGKILVDGSLLNSVDGPEIEVTGSMGEAAAITVDWDG